MIQTEGEEMGTKIKVFVNLPVKNLKRSVEFFARLGFKFNLQFTMVFKTRMGTFGN